MSLAMRRLDEDLVSLASSGFKKEECTGFRACWLFHTRFEALKAKKPAVLLGVSLLYPRRKS